MPIAENQALIFYYTERALKIKLLSRIIAEKMQAHLKKSTFSQQLIDNIAPTGLLTLFL